MLDDIREIIRKNLPAEVGDTLRQYLEEAEKVKEQLAARAAELKTTRSILEESRTHAAQMEGELRKAGDLAVREKKLVEGETRLAVTLAEAAVKAAEFRSQEMKELVCLVFKNPTIRRTESGNAPAGVDKYGNTQSGYTNKDSTETVE